MAKNSNTALSAEKVTTTMFAQPWGDETRHWMHVEYELTLYLNTIAACMLFFQLRRPATKLRNFIKDVAVEKS